MALAPAAATSELFRRQRGSGDILPAGLYAPLRVFLYEDEKGGSVFEYDNPSLFAQFDDEQVTAVARGLDDALERALRRAAE